MYDKLGHNPPFELPSNDEGILDLVFKEYVKQPSSMWISIGELNGINHWKLSMNECHRIEKLLIATGFLEYKTKGYYQAMKLNLMGLKALSEFSLYSDFLKAKQTAIRQNTQIEEIKNNLAEISLVNAKAESWSKKHPIFFETIKILIAGAIGSLLTLLIQYISK